MHTAKSIDPQSMKNLSNITLASTIAIIIIAAPGSPDFFGSRVLWESIGNDQ
jgi:hypothetical protein